jgi:hypothetical protein
LVKKEDAERRAGFTPQSGRNQENTETHVSDLYNEERWLGDEVEVE